MDASFIFDQSPDPKPGQAWDLNQNVDVGNGYSLLISEVRYDLMNGTFASLSFDMSSANEVIKYATLLDQAHPLQGGGGGGGVTCSPGPFTTMLYYSEPLPKGPITVTIRDIIIGLPGPWRAEWMP